MLLLGIFYSREKPLLNTFLRPIMDDINNVYRQGKYLHAQHFIPNKALHPVGITI